MSDTKHVIVVGGGIAGLGCARALREAGLTVDLLEETGRVGGLIRSERNGERLLEAGPNTVQATAGMMDVVRSSSAADALVEARPRLPRYVYARGRLHPVPTGPGALLLTRLLSRRAKWRLLREPWAPPWNREGDESVESFFARRFGEEISRYLVGPMVQGIYAGDPGRLSAASVFPRVVGLEAGHGSVLGGAVRQIPGLIRGRREPSARRLSLVTFRGGLEALPKALGDELGDALHLGVRATTLERADDGWRVGCADGREHRADAVVLATPAAAAVPLVRDHSEEAADLLAHVESAPLAVAHVAVPDDDAFQGFGFLVPRGEGVRLLGCLWVSSIFFGRAADGEAHWTIFLGGMTDPAAPWLDDREIADVIESDLRRTTGRSAPVRLLDVHRYEGAIPQYTIGHGARTRRLREQIRSELPGVFLAGNYLDGVSVGDCLERGLRTGREVAGFLTAP